MRVAARSSTVLFLLPAAAVFFSFFLTSLSRYPVPAPNEPHYLCKAKHYWDPDWCAKDLFLASSNAHLVFYQTFGLPTRWSSLEQVALLGRVLGLLILAIGWTALVRQLVPGRWPPVFAAWIYLALSAVGNLSGEWIVGGIESKVIAYGLLFAAAAVGLSIADGEDHETVSLRIVTSGILAGVAISFHPVVGIWGFAAGLFAAVVSVGTRRLTAFAREFVGSISIGTLCLFLTAAPGVVAGFRAASGSSVEADYIQVYYRLAHHLDPMRFEPIAWLGYAILAAVWTVTRPRMARREGEQWFFWFVIGTALIAAVGLAAGLRVGPPENMTAYAYRWKLLKLYPFRLFDVLLPIAVAVAGAGMARRWCELACQARPGRRTVGLVWMLCGLPALIAAFYVAPDARPAMSASQLRDWLDVCRWIKQNTSTDALILTPVESSWAFKWFAERAEFVNVKDCPQDSSGIVEWNNRLRFVPIWDEGDFEEEEIAAPLRRSFVAHGITHVVGPPGGMVNLLPLYENESFGIYPLNRGLAISTDAKR